MYLLNMALCLFQHAAARRRLACWTHRGGTFRRFQHAAARRRLGRRQTEGAAKACFNTQPPEGGWKALEMMAELLIVSTRSRPKAAGCLRPSEPRPQAVSTRSRPKAAGWQKQPTAKPPIVSTRSRPKAAGSSSGSSSTSTTVSTRSRPKAAGNAARYVVKPYSVSTRSRPKAAGRCSGFGSPGTDWFQHAAARRRLAQSMTKIYMHSWVSTRSRPKAAGFYIYLYID